MDLLRFFTRNEPIAGLEVTDTELRLVLIERFEIDQTIETKTEKEKGTFITSERGMRIIESAHVSLQSGVVVSACVKDKKRFIEALQTLVGKMKIHIRYVVLAIPANELYVRYFTFPKNVRGEKLTESMKLALNFQLPYARDAAYTDWEEFDLDEETAAVLAASPSVHIDEYRDVFAAAGIHIVAVESAAMSALRAFQDEDKKPHCLLIVYKESFSAALIHNGHIRLERVAPFDLIHKKEAGIEMRKLIDFFESDIGERIERVVIIGDGDVLHSVKKAISDAKIISAESEIIATGAAMRGATDRSTDKAISLLPIGTEEAYEQQKAIVFAHFIAGLLTSLAAFFVVVYAGAYLFLKTIDRTFTTRLNALKAIPFSEEDKRMEERAKAFSDQLKTTSALVRAMPRWSVVIETIKKSAPPEIEIAGVVLPSVEGHISVVGVGKTRADIKQFKRALEEHGFFTDVELPVGNIADTENVSFSLGMRLADMEQIYFHE